LTVTDSDPRRQLLLELLQAGLAAVDGRRRTADSLEALRTAGSGPTSYHVAAVGKAAGAMALGAHDALGGSIRRMLIIAKDGHLEAGVNHLPGVEILESSHPLPDERSLRAGQRLCEFVADMPAAVMPLFLISGGASSLVEVLTPGSSLQELRQLNAAGLASGADIGELNARRRTISRLKGGGLTARLNGRPALALFVSDVPGDDPAVIGSGILGAVPGAGGDCADQVTRRIIARIEDAMQAVGARAVNLRTWISAARFAGDADRLAVRLTHELCLSGAQVCVWGGESVVRLPANPGRGGRNQHLALAAARLIAGEEDLLFLAVGTDGTDGPTDDAGALVDGETCARVTVAGLDVERSLVAADSQAALAAAGDLVHTGPTGTNVGDLAVGLKMSTAQARSWYERNPGAHSPLR
jgi:glycerate 2-kinase